MDISQYDYQLPQSLVAQYPSENRSSSRLLVVGQSLDSYKDILFSNLSSVLNPGDMLVVNDTRVLPARVLAKKPTGGKVEIMLEHVIDDQSALVLIRSNKTIRDGQELILGDFRVVVSGRSGQFFKIQFPSGCKAKEIFEQWGSTPLPPYISRKSNEIDKKRYQTVYAENSGAVAAPTAGLHFDQSLIDQLKSFGVVWGAITLHVGAGTFQPVRCQDVQSHKMHAERFVVNEDVCKKIDDTQTRGGKIVAVGTTVVRALESVARSGGLTAKSAETELFILPGFEFKVVDGLVTNFHLPRSTLLMMVSAFAGYETVMSAYRYAIDNRYRFFSYGDAMYLQRKQ